MEKRKLNKDFLESSSTIKKYDGKEQLAQDFYKVIEGNFNLKNSNILEIKLAVTLCSEINEIEQRAQEIVDENLMNCGIFYWERSELIPSSYELENEELYNIIDNKVEKTISDLLNEYIVKKAKEFADMYTVQEGYEMLNSKNIKSITAEFRSQFYDYVEENLLSDKLEKVKTEIITSWAGYLIPNLLEILKDTYKDKLEEYNDEIKALENTNKELIEEYEIELEELEEELCDLKDEKVLDYKKISELEDEIRDTRQLLEGEINDEDVELRRKELKPEMEKIQKRIAEIDLLIEKL